MSHHLLCLLICTEGHLCACLCDFIRSKLYEKRCVKDEQRKAHRFMREGSSRTAREPMQGNTSSSGARQPLDPEFVRTQKLNDTPEAYYNTDCGSKKVQPLSITWCRLDTTWLTLRHVSRRCSGASRTRRTRA